MNKVLIAVLLAGGLFGLIVTVAPAREAKADVITDVAEACASNWSACLAAAETAYEVAVDIWNWVDDAFAGISYLEECLGEGCYTEEVSEDYSYYKEEAINEGGDSFEEIKETVFHDSHRGDLNDAQEKAFVLVMLKDFQRRGWAVRAQDITKAGG